MQDRKNVDLNNEEAQMKKKARKCNSNLEKD